MDDHKSILPKANVSIIRRYEKDTAAQFEHLKNHLNWQYDEATDRRSCNMGADYLILGHMHQAQPFDPLILKMMRRLNDEFSVALNACFANYYADGNAVLPLRTNTGLQTNLDQPIMTIVLGGTRRGVFKDIETDEEFEVLLNDGDLCIMGINSQKHYLYGIRASDKYTEPRISLAFRTINSWSSE